MNKMTMTARKGATFIEYALLAGLVAIVVAVAAMLFGGQLKSLFMDTGDQVQNVSSGVKSAGLKANISTDKTN